MADHVFKELGRIVTALHPEMANELIKKYKRHSIDLDSIELIYQQILEQFPDMQDHQAKEMLIAIVYRLFVPASFLPPLKEIGKDAQAAGKLPPGVRDRIAKVLGFRHPEEVNRYKGYVVPFLKNSRYVKKMSAVTNAVGLTDIDLSL